VELLITTRQTLEEDGWLPGDFEIGDEHEEAGKIRQAADKYIESVLEFNPDATEQLDKRDKHLALVENLGGKARNAGNKLIGQIRDYWPVLEKQLEEKSWLYTNFSDIGKLSNDLDPEKNHLKDDGFPSFLTRLPFLYSKVRRFFSKFETERKKAEQLVHSLEKVSDMFEKDIVLYKSQIKSFKEMCVSIGRNLYLGKLIDKGMGDALEKEVMEFDPRREFIETEQIPRLKSRTANLGLQLDLHREYIVSLTVLLINTETLYKALLQARKDLVNAFNLGAALAADRARITVDPLTFSEDGGKDVGDDDLASVPKDLTSLSAAFLRLYELSDSVKTFMNQSLSAFKESASGLPEFQRKTEEAFKSSRPVDFDITLKEGTEG
jgi:hypothetical protein